MSPENVPASTMSCAKPRIVRHCDEQNCEINRGVGHPNCEQGGAVPHCKYCGFNAYLETEQNVIAPTTSDTFNVTTSTNDTMDSDNSFTGFITNKDQSIILLVLVGVALGFVIILLMFMIYKFHKPKVEKPYILIEKNLDERQAVVRYTGNPLVDGVTVESNASRQATIPSFYEIEKGRISLGGSVGNGHSCEVLIGFLAPPKAHPDLPTLPVAIKISKFSNIEILKEELALFANIGVHPNIIYLIGIVTLKREIHLVMELCEHGSLHGQLVRYRKYFTVLSELVHVQSPGSSAEKYRAEVMPDWEETVCARKASEGFTIFSTSDQLSICMQVACGMKYLASRQIVHRDLAARNVLLTPQRIVRISDFELSRVTDNEEYIASQRQIRIPERWCALESLQSGVFTTMSDVWSFGILLYEVYSMGERPYPDLKSSLIEYLRKGYRNERPPNCHEEICDLMEACWAENPEDRPNFDHCLEVHKRHLSLAAPQMVVAVGALLSQERKRIEAYEQWREN